MTKNKSGGGWQVVSGSKRGAKKSSGNAPAAAGKKNPAAAAPRSMRDIVQNAVRSASIIPTASASGLNSNTQQQSSRSQEPIASTLPLNPFAAKTQQPPPPQTKSAKANKKLVQQQQQQKKQQQKNSSSTAATATVTATDEDYVPAEELLRRGNEFFASRSRQEKKLTKVAKDRIAEMKRVNAKGGDSKGFKFVVPKSAKKMAQRLAGDVDVQDTDAINDEEARKLLPAHTSTVVGGSDGEQSKTAGLREDDRPMRKKKPREAKERSDFYAWQKWKKWTQNAENFLSRGRLSRRVFDGKRKFRSV